MGIYTLKPHWLAGAHVAHAHNQPITKTPEVNCDV